ncbi:ABC transporter ATP-binding protein [Furfurilactobacillus sp. WILCCON 0119]
MMRSLPTGGQRNGRTATESFSWGEFFKILKQARPNMAMLIIGFLISLVGTGIGLVIPLFTKGLVDHFSLAHLSYTLVAALVGAFILQAIASCVSNYMMGYMGEQVVMKLRKLVWEKLLHLSVPYYDDHTTGELASHLVNDTTVWKSLIVDQLPSFVSGIVSMVGAVVILLVMDWRMTIIILLAVPVVGLIIAPIGNMMRRLSIQLQTQTADFNGIATQTLSEIRLVKSSNGEANETKRGNAGIEHLFKTGVSEAKTMSVISPLMLLAMMGMMVAVIGYGGVRVSEGSLSIGTMVAFLLYLFQVIAPATQFAQFFSQLQKTKGATVRIAGILDAEPEQADQQKEVDVSGQTLSMDHVTFGYEKDQPILHDMSFTAHPNRTIAFVGPSGAGKSTIFALLERFYQPTSGKVKLGNRDVADISLASWRSQIGYVAQDSAILAGTIRDNLTYGLDHPVSDDELWHVLELAFAKQFVAEMPAQLLTEVGERGVKLSGGQKQRLAIARAFLRDPKILMLDEATASLDSESEEMVHRALNNLMKNRTTLIIAHRLSTVVDADNIIFVEHGTITGQGTHKELLASHDLYREYVKEQFKN